MEKFCSWKKVELEKKARGFNASQELYLKSLISGMKLMREENHKKALIW